MKEQLILSTQASSPTTRRVGWFNAHVYPTLVLSAGVDLGFTVTFLL